MENPSIKAAGFMTQADAMFKKSFAFQKRNGRETMILIVFPALLCWMLSGLTKLMNESYKEAQINEITQSCVNQGNPQDFCDPKRPGKNFAVMKVPLFEYRAARVNFMPFDDLPNPSCKKIEFGDCPVTVLLTGRDRSLGESVGKYLFPVMGNWKYAKNRSDFESLLLNVVLGSDSDAGQSIVMEPNSLSSLYIIQPQCPSDPVLAALPVTTPTSSQSDITCLQGLYLWRNDSAVVNDELFKGSYRGNREGKTNEIMAAYDFLTSDKNNFNVDIWFNLTEREGGLVANVPLARLPRSVNMVSNAYLQFLRGTGVKMSIDFIKEMPKRFASFRKLDVSSILGPLFFTWVVLQLFPVILTSLVYEKQQNLRIMMKMHGLRDGPYLMISYAYFFLVSSAYILCFVLFGAIIGLQFFISNNYSIQLVFYFVFANQQIAFTFLVATLFSNVKTATVCAHIFVFGSGLLGQFLFMELLQDPSFPKHWILLMQLNPGFSLYRGLYEFGQSATSVINVGAYPMRWKDLSKNGMDELLISMCLEWFVLILLAYYFDQVMSVGSGVRKHPLFFLQTFRGKSPSMLRRLSLQSQGSVVSVQIERPDVHHEREKVELLLGGSNPNYFIVDNIKKMYPGKDGNPDKFAVRGLSLALPPAECFGMLGPNGAGKTSFISMMIGLTMPTSGTAFIQGLDIRTDMDRIYTSMGVCPQHDLLWETLTGREHLQFYGRLKNLKGADLTRAVDESLKSVNLFDGGVGDKKAMAYSGGMKRRLSVAISLIGDPKVVYMDEPSTGLDPASRQTLWNVVKHAKKNRAIILTTHSMEEAEALCDRVGIFVDGGLQCIGNPKELMSRYGGCYVFTMTTSSSHEAEVEELVLRLSPNAAKIYHLSGTQKFELPKEEVRISDVFQAVATAKEKFTIHAWGLADTTLEDVFIKVARGCSN